LPFWKKNNELVTRGSFFMDLLDHLKATVTRENVNCIPDDWDRSNFISLFVLSVCHARKYGFLQLAMLRGNFIAVQWVIDQFGGYIDWEHAVIARVLSPISNEVPILEFMARRFSKVIPNCVRAGARRGGVEAFRKIAKDVRHYGLGKTVVVGELESLLHAGIGDYNYNFGPEWLNQLTSKYRWRRNRCKAVVIQMLGLVRFRRDQCFPGLDRRLLNEMFRGVWRTRYTSERWDEITPIIKRR
jgi:hypothetical protein